MTGRAADRAVGFWLLMGVFWAVTLLVKVISQDGHGVLTAFAFLFTDLSVAYLIHDRESLRRRIEAAFPWLVKR